MNFYFEMAINILEVTLILSFLVQYFGYRIKYPTKYIWTIIIGLVSFCNIAFFSWNNLYESYARSLQILINIIFCCVLLCGPLLQKIFVSAFTMGLVAIIATFTTLLIAKLSESDVTFLLSQFSGIRITSILLTKLLFFIITRIILRVKETGRIKWLDFMPLVVIPALSIITITLVMYAAIQEPHIQNIVFYAVCIILALNILIYFQLIKYIHDSSCAFPLFPPFCLLIIMFFAFGFLWKISVVLFFYLLCFIVSVNIFNMLIRRLLPRHIHLQMIICRLRLLHRQFLSLKWCMEQLKPVSTWAVHNLPGCHICQNI